MHPAAKNFPQHLQIDPKQFRKEEIISFQKSFGSSLKEFLCATTFFGRHSTVLKPTFDSSSLVDHIEIKK